MEFRFIGLCNKFYFLNVLEENKMNKAQLISAVSTRCGLSRKDSDLAVNAVFDIITEELAKGERVQLVGFGSFEVRDRPERAGRNPLNGEPLIIKASRAVTFKPGKTVKVAVQGENTAEAAE